MKRYKPIYESNMSMDSFNHAEILSGEGAIPFGALKKGEKFTWGEKGADGKVHSRTNEIFIKLQGTSYKNSETGEKYRTGLKTAIMPLN